LNNYDGKENKRKWLKTIHFVGTILWSRKRITYSSKWTTIIRNYSIWKLSNYDIHISSYNDDQWQFN
jgi:hypothetical protein